MLAAGAIGATLAGGTAFAVLVALAVVLMTREWPELCLAEGGLRPLWRPRPPAFVVAFVALAAVALVLLLMGRLRAAIALAVLGAVVVAAFAPGGARDRLLFGFGLPYVIVPAAALLWLASGPEGRFTLLWLYAVVWATDIGGYVFGKVIGGPRLAPRISPNKTWSGAIGGLLLATVAAAGFVLAVPAANLVSLSLAAIGVSIIAQFGDLLESAVKRHFAVKDSGSIIPGHGGVFDRLDGLLAAAPFLALLAATKGDLGFLWR